MKEITENVEKMTLKDYYAGLATNEEKVAFRNRLMAETNKSYPTVYSWLNGNNVPSFLERQMITNISNGVVKWEQ